MQISTLLIFITYQIIQLAALPILPIYLLIRKIKKKPVFGNLQERIGFVPKNKSKKKTVWLHAVSVGEILSIQNLIDQIKKKLPDHYCYVTTGTIAGKSIAQKNLNCDQISFLPYDFLLPIFLAFKRIKPNSLIIIEAETWPNLLFVANWLKIPIYMINARISTRSKKKYFTFKFLFKNLLEKFDLILTQSEQDTQNFESLGISDQKIETLGNIKALNVLIKKEKIKPETTIKSYPTLLIGSIHPGELNIYIDLYKQLKINFPSLKIIIAPRHFHWKQELLSKIKSTKFPFYLWDNEPNLKNEPADSYIDLTNKIFETNDILLVCKLGELFNLYQTSDIFFLGGTFIPVGGHNLLEPAVWAKPSIIGPYYHNCNDITNKLCQINGIIKVKNKIELYDQTKNLLFNQTRCLNIGNNSFSWLQNEAIQVNEKIKQLIKTISK
ncbi:MAG: glycosyltransferase N-terminal domain-containing protein [bacterium]